MTAKEYLKQYENIVRRINILTDRINVLENEADCIRSVTDYDGLPHGSNVGHPTEQRAVQIVDEKLKREALRNEAFAEGQKIFDTIMDVKGGNEQDVLYLRYIKLMKWEEITVELGYSWQHTHRLHRQALEQVSKILSMR